ncbi:hypothetical protein MNBD_NITROSPINAE02-407 [hydrothermal vent metagenome]|uniref:Uncharacterized protein n=1 Tax=hydrothermal vent metagenome TaxID=652676 RepID=A0A3B1CMB6_9ZZZZ
MNVSLFKKGIFLGFVSGVASSWFGIVLNKVTGVFPFESSLPALMLTFAVGGGIFGIAAGGFMTLTNEIFLVDRPVLKAVIISAGIWLALRAGGMALSLMDHDRYHPDVGQTAQGFALALLTGGLLGILWNSKMGSDRFK